MNENKINIENNLNLKRRISTEPFMKRRKNIKVRNICSFCGRKLRITNIFECRCKKLFCSLHRFYDIHKCSFDYKKFASKKLELMNPKMAFDKVNRRI